MFHYLTRSAIRLVAFYLRWTPLMRGRWRLISFALPGLRREGRAMGRRIVRCRHGFRFNADLGDWLGQYVYLMGVYEPPTAEVISALIEPGDTVLDVGANAGFFTLLASRRAGSQGKVLAFEPIPGVRAALQANLDLNRVRNVTVFDRAASDRSGVITIYEGPEGHKGLSSLRPLERASRKLEIQALAIDDLLAELPPVRFVKIDVEGAELSALIGMQALIRRDRPYLVIEFTDQYLRGFGHSGEMLGQWLSDQGYTLFEISDTGLSALTGPVEGLPKQFNALCLPGGNLPVGLEKRLRNVR